MSYENTAGLGVYNHFGARDLQDGLLSGGKLPVHGQVEEFVVYAKASDFSGAGLFTTQYTLPAGSIPLDAIFEVTTTFTQTGGTTSTALAVGTATSEGTNGFSISDAATSLAAVTERDASGAGTWAAALAADTSVGIALVAGGGTITSVNAGEAKITVRYFKV